MEAQSEQPADDTRAAPVLGAVADLVRAYRAALAEANQRQEALASRLDEALSRLAAAPSDEEAEPRTPSTGQSEARLRAAETLTAEAEARALNAETRAARAEQSLAVARETIAVQQSTLEVLKQREIALLRAVRTYLTRTERAFTRMQEVAREAVDHLEHLEAAHARATTDTEASVFRH